MKRTFHDKFPTYKPVSLSLSLCEQL